MSNVLESAEQVCDAITAPCSAIETILSPRITDLGGFSVRRLLPTAKRKMVGPWIFFDEINTSAFTGLFKEIWTVVNDSCVGSIKPNK